ncbi:hypothetical protein LINGRAHAP2_LOCUS8316, partial [Linum grandiflorum]
FPSPLLNFPPYHPSSPLILFSILLLLLPLRPQGSSAAARFLLSIGDSDGGGREAAASILFLRYIFLPLPLLCFWTWVSNLIGMSPVATSGEPSDDMQIRSENPLFRI